MKQTIKSQVNGFNRIARQGKSLETARCFLHAFAAFPEWEAFFLSAAQREGSGTGKHSANYRVRGAVSIKPQQRLWPCRQAGSPVLPHRSGTSTVRAARGGLGSQRCSCPLQRVVSGSGRQGLRANAARAAAPEEQEGIYGLCLPINTVKNETACFRAC